MAQKTLNWSNRVTNAEAIARSGGRKRYNALRQMTAKLRQIKVRELMNASGWQRGTQQRIAETLNVSAVTISRDVKTILSEMELSSY